MRRFLTALTATFVLTLLGPVAVAVAAASEQPAGGDNPVTGPAASENANGGQRVSPTPGWRGHRAQGQSPPRRATPTGPQGPARPGRTHRGHEFDVRRNRRQRRWSRSIVRSRRNRSANEPGHGPLRHKVGPRQPGLGQQRERKRATKRASERPRAEHRNGNGHGQSNRRRRATGHRKRWCGHERLDERCQHGARLMTTAPRCRRTRQQPAAAATRPSGCESATARHRRSNGSRERRDHDANRGARKRRFSRAVERDIGGRGSGHTVAGLRNNAASDSRGAVPTRESGQRGGRAARVQRRRFRRR